MSQVPAGVRSLTWGEGDGPDVAPIAIAIKAPASDTISSTDIGIFATNANLNTADPPILSGDALRVSAWGFLATAAPTTLLMRVLNETQVLLETAAALTSVTGTRGWKIEALLIADGLDSEAQGEFVINTGANATQRRDMVNGSRTGFPITIGHLQIQVTWGTPDPGNTITLREFVVQHFSPQTT